MTDYQGNPVWSGNRINYKSAIYDVIKIYRDRIKVRAQDNRVLFLTPAQVALSDRIF